MMPFDWALAILAFVGLVLAIIPLISTASMGLISIIGGFVVVLFLIVLFLDIKARKEIKKKNAIKEIKEKLSIAQCAFEEERDKILKFIDIIGNFFSPEWDRFGDIEKGASREYVYIPNYFVHMFATSIMGRLEGADFFPDVVCNRFVIDDDKVDIRMEDWPLKEDEYLSFFKRQFFLSGCSLYESCYEDKNIGFHAIDRIEEMLNQKSPSSISMFYPSDVLFNKDRSYSKYFPDRPKDKKALMIDFIEYWNGLLTNKIALSEENYRMMQASARYSDYSLNRDDIKKIEDFFKTGVNFRSKTEEDYIRMKLGEYFFMTSFVMTHCRIINLMLLLTIIVIRRNRIKDTLELLNQPDDDLVKMLKDRIIPLKSMPIELKDAFEIADRIN